MCTNMCLRWCCSPTSLRHCKGRSSQNRRQSSRMAPCTFTFTHLSKPVVNEALAMAVWEMVEHLQWGPIPPPAEEKQASSLPCVEAAVQSSCTISFGLFAENWPVVFVQPDPSITLEGICGLDPVATVTQSVDFGDIPV